MGARQQSLVQRPGRERRKPRVLAQMRDAGEPGVLFRCNACGWEDWIPACFRDDNRKKLPGEIGMAEARRGYPCPVCNEQTEGE